MTMPSASSLSPTTPWQPQLASTAPSAHVDAVSLSTTPAVTPMATPPLRCLPVRKPQRRRQRRHVMPTATASPSASVTPTTMLSVLRGDCDAACPQPQPLADDDPGVVSSPRPRRPLTMPASTSHDAAVNISSAPAMTLAMTPSPRCLSLLVSDDAVDLSHVPAITACPLASRSAAVTVTLCALSPSLSPMITTVSSPRLDRAVL
jgi:hypothetical protein